MANLAFRIVGGLHRGVYRLTGGKVGGKIGKAPVLLLTTTGRKSGAERVSSLTYLQDGDDQVVVASKGGSPAPPAWLLNLQAKPEVKVQIGRKSHPAKARVIGGDDPDYARLWEGANKLNGGRYAEYQSWTDREIKLVVLSPAG